MAFIDARLLECVADGFEGKKTYATRIHPLRSGHEARNKARSNGRWTFYAVAGSLDPEDWPLILDAFDAVQGSGDSFRFHNPLDGSVVGQSLGDAPAGSTPVQLVKSSTFATVTRTRNITKPVAGSVTVYQTGVAKAGTYSTLTGLFTPSTAWTEGEPLTADFEWDVPVRFEADELAPTYEDFSAIGVPLNLIEVFGE